MSDASYEADFVLWSARQAAALRRLRSGERPGDVDWDNLLEEVEDLGRSATRAVRSLLRRALEHLMKAAAWPEAESRGHWLAEASSFLRDAEDQFAPSMRQQLDLTRLYAGALRSVSLIGRVDGRAPAELLAECPLSLDDLPAPELDVSAAAETLRQPTG